MSVVSVRCVEILSGRCFPIANINKYARETEAKAKHQPKLQQTEKFE